MIHSIGIQKSEQQQIRAWWMMRSREMKPTHVEGVEQC